MEMNMTHSTMYLKNPSSINKYLLLGFGDRTRILEVWIQIFIIVRKLTGLFVALPITVVREPKPIPCHGNGYDPFNNVPQES
jgi:hypothetical protein